MSNLEEHIRQLAQSAIESGISCKSVELKLRKEMIDQMLVMTNGNQSESSRRLKINRYTLAASLRGGWRRK